MDVIDDFKEWMDNRISALGNMIADAQRQDAIIQEKIDRLNEASRQITASYDKANATKNDIGGYSPGDNWKGNKRDTFNQEKDDVRNKCNTYCDALMRTRDQLQSKRLELEAQQWDLLGMIQSWKSQAESLWNQLTN